MHILQGTHRGFIIGLQWENRMKGQTYTSKRRTISSQESDHAGKRQAFKVPAAANNSQKRSGQFLSITTASAVCTYGTNRFTVPLRLSQGPIGCRKLSACLSRHLWPYMERQAYLQVSCFGSARLPAFKPPQRLNQSQKRVPAAEDEGQVSAKSLEMLAGMINQSINYICCL